MVKFSFEVTNYELKIGHELSGGGGGPRSRGHLVCHGEDGHRFVIYFSAPGNTVAAPIYNPEYKWATIDVPVNELPHYVDMVRNEKPVFANLNSEKPQWNSISTKGEPVGEEEGCGESGGSGGSGGASGTNTRGFNPFEENALGHAWSNSFILGLCARHVYGNGTLDAGGEFMNNFQARFEPWMTHGTGGTAKFDLVSNEKLIGGTGLQAVVMSNDRYIIVAFRGTQSILSASPQDWLTNTAFAGAPVPAFWAEPFVGIHNGWLAAIDSSYADLLERIEEHRGNGTKPLWITGHSMGGSLANILALRLQTSGDYPVQGVHTYAAPPAGTGNYFGSYSNQGLQRRTQSWVNNQDIGPMLFRPLFTPVGQKNFIDSNGNVTLNTLDDPIMLPNIADHSMDDYASLIRDRLSDDLKDEVPLFN